MTADDDPNERQDISSKPTSRHHLVKSAWVKSKPPWARSTFQLMHSPGVLALHLTSHVCRPDNEAFARRLLSTMARSGSLHTVSMDWNSNALWDESKLRMLRFVFSRNIELPHLLTAPRLTDQHSDSTFAHFTTVFECAMQASRMAPNCVLTGLLSLGDFDAFVSTTCTNG
jgi:hypothetical protein